MLRTTGSIIRHAPGVALIGDAAAASDPCWGCGLSLTLSEVRCLRDCLISESDWTKATERYAVEHDRYYGILRGLENWWAELLWTVGPLADGISAFDDS